jgi:O-antigen/teichoic acid export membrane protein
MADDAFVAPAKPQRMRLSSLVSRLWSSTVMWSWGFNGLRLASGLLLLPLLVRLLSTADFGFYYVLLSLTSFAGVLDSVLSIAIGRSVSYAMGGAKELLPFGLQSGDTGDGQPNYKMLWLLLSTTRSLYRFLSLLYFVILGAAGTYIVSLQVHETSQPLITWLSWTFALASAVFDLYFSWWNSFLRNMNQVLISGRIDFLGYTIRLVLACGFLLAGYGLLSLPVAGLIASTITRQMSRRRCLNLLAPFPCSPPSRAEVLGLLRTLWPNSWRASLQIGSSYLRTSVSVIICSLVFGLAANAEYGLSFQIATLIQGMALVWTGVKWPLVGQYRARQDYAALRRLLWPRVWLQSATFIVLAVLAYAFGPLLIEFIGSEKKILPDGWFLLLLFNAFLETQIVFWTTLLSMENRIPSLWPMVLTNAATLLLLLALVNFTPLGLGAFVIAPFLTGSLFNYWFWLKAGAKSLQTTWFRFTFSLPE